MDLLVGVLIFIVIFAIVAYGLYWICTTFFPNFPPALWICGLLLLIVLLIAASRFLALDPLVFMCPRCGR